MLNMSYNRIDNLSFSSIPRCAKSILALDASFNNICDLRNCIIDVSNLERIKVISLEGNAIALAKNYRKYVMQELLGRICYLDGGKIDIKKEGEKA